MIPIKMTELKTVKNYLKKMPLASNRMPHQRLKRKRKALMLFWKREKNGIQWLKKSTAYLFLTLWLEATHLLLRWPWML